MKKNLFICFNPMALLSMIAMVTMVTMTACGGVAFEEQADVRIAVPAAFVSQDSVDRIVLRISGPDLENNIEQILRPPFTENASFDVRVPFGKTRIFEVFAPFAGGDNRMLYGRQVYSVLKEDVASADVFNLPTFPMTFTNFAQDASGASDVVSSSFTQPDITSFHMYRAPAGADIICAGSVVMEVGFNQEFVAPTALSFQSLTTFIELDTDDNPTTGSSRTRIDAAKGTLNNVFTQGTDLLIVSQNRTPALAFSDNILSQRFPSVVSLYDISGETDINISSINPWTTYNSTTHTLYVCLPNESFNVLDPDGIGRLNILSGIDGGVDRVEPFTGNDILYRSGYIRYDLNIDLTTIPGAETVPGS